jgi:hypothetical protein
LDKLINNSSIDYKCIFYTYFLQISKYIFTEALFFKMMLMLSMTFHVMTVNDSVFIHQTLTYFMSSSTRLWHILCLHPPDWHILCLHPPDSDIFYVFIHQTLTYFMSSSTRLWHILCSKQQYFWLVDFYSFEDNGKFVLKKGNCLVIMVVIFF